jgi:hypothetical protein
MSATNRLQKLLTSKDKKQCILNMAAANEIDLALIQLLQQNIDGAKSAGREDVAGMRFISASPRGDTAHCTALVTQPRLWPNSFKSDMYYV